MFRSNPSALFSSLNFVGADVFENEEDGNNQLIPAVPFKGANDYFKAKKQADLLEDDLSIKEKEVYDLKHELILSDAKAQTATDELENALEKIKELEKEIIRLQSR